MCGIEGSFGVGKEVADLLAECPGQVGETARKEPGRVENSVRRNGARSEPGAAEGTHFTQEGLHDETPDPGIAASGDQPDQGGRHPGVGLVHFLANQRHQQTSRPPEPQYSGNRRGGETSGELGGALLIDLGGVSETETVCDLPGRSERPLWRSRRPRGRRSPHRRSARRRCGVCSPRLSRRRPSAAGGPRGPSVLSRYRSSDSQPQPPPSSPPRPESIEATGEASRRRGAGRASPRGGDSSPGATRPPRRRSRSSPRRRR